MISFALVLALAAAPAGPAYGLFVGVSNYRNLENLPYTDRDAHRVAEAFARIDGPIGVSPKRRMILTNRAASRAEVTRAVAELAARARAGGDSDPTLVVFFSGHGDGGRPGGGGEAISLWNARAGDEGGDITPEILAEILAPFGRRAVILDACYAGGFVRNVAGPRTLLLSAGPAFREVSTLEARASGGALALVLLEALSGAADADRDGEITETEIATFLRTEVGRRCETCGRRVEDGRSRCPFDGEHLSGWSAVVAGGTGLGIWGRIDGARPRGESSPR